MKQKHAIGTNVVKPVYYGNWGDLWGFPLAAKLLPIVTKIPFLTPNVITMIGFTSFTLGSLLLFLTTVPYHLYLAAFLLPFGFFLDDLDGQVARERKMYSEIGNYLDKVLDVLKIFIVSSSLSYAVYLETHNILHIFLGFIAASFFYMRYYIKLETVLRQVELDKDYLDKSSRIMSQIKEDRFARHQELSKTFTGKLIVFWELNRTFFLVDEAEFAVFTGFFALINHLELGLWIIAIAQVAIFVWRFYERAHQTVNKSDRLYYFMRK
ncbi:CDP-alcohol phosphatidyltransferase family protein [Candidatus Microgenomates bacterium]|nr:CDP-alcohol phosphatidyltransferase family protein [Candidatus Microgenomates bacterium]